MRKLERDWPERKLRWNGASSRRFAEPVEAECESVKMRSTREELNARVEKRRAPAAKEIRCDEEAVLWVVGTRS